MTKSLTTPIDNLVVVRKGKESDYPIVIDSWLKSYEQSEDARRLRMTRSEFRRSHTRLIYIILQRSNLLVATDPLDDNHVFGWLCYEKKKRERQQIQEEIAIVHYVSVKGLYWNSGIATELLKNCGITKEKSAIYTHRTEKGKLLGEYLSEYNPYLAWGIAA